MTEAALHSPSSPFELLQAWFHEAEQSEPNDPNAAALATADKVGQPSVRMVLLKHIDAGGFRFFTNAESQKGRELAENPRASLCIHWKSLRRQVRADGPVTLLRAADADEYFHSRSRRSQIAAAISHQSERLTDRATLERAFEEFSAVHQDGIVPRPASWLGYALQPERVEFWSDGKDRLHKRLLFIRHDGAWERTLLYP